MNYSLLVECQMLNVSINLSESLLLALKGEGNMQTERGDFPAYGLPWYPRKLTFSGISLDDGIRDRSTECTMQAWKSSENVNQNE